MRSARARQRAVTTAAGCALLAAASWGVVAGTAPTQAAAATGGGACEPLTGATTVVYLCVEVVPTAVSAVPGNATTWAVSAWATGGDVPAATITLQTPTAGAGTPVFTSGCGTNGTTACDLGAVDAAATQRKLQAQFTVPVTATTVSSASLTAIATATNLLTDAQTTGTMSISTPPAPVAGSSPATAGSSPVTSPPTLGAAASSQSLSSGGDASGLFPTLDPSFSASSNPSSSPSFSASPSPSSAATETEKAKQVANTPPLTGTVSSLDAQVAGLAALVFAVVLAVIRLSVRRPAPAAAAAPAANATPAEAPAAESTKATEGSDGADAVSLDASKPDA